MKKGMLIGIGIGIVVVVAVGVGLAISAQSQSQTQQNDEVTPSETTEGRHFEVELKEGIGVKDKP